MKGGVEKVLRVWYLYVQYVLQRTTSSVQYRVVVLSGVWWCLVGESTTGEVDVCCGRGAPTAWPAWVVGWGSGSGYLVPPSP